MKNSSVSRLALAASALVCVALHSVVSPCAAAAQLRHTRGITLSGIVTDTLGQPLALTSITDGQGRVRALTDNSGRFQLGGVTGRVSVVVKRLGFRPVRLDTVVSAEGPLFLVFRLVPLPLTLGEEVVSAPSGPADRALKQIGFYDRMRDKRLGAHLRELG